MMLIKVSIRVIMKIYTGNFNDMTYSNPMYLSDNVNRIYIKGKDGKPIVFRTPEMTLFYDEIRNSHMLSDLILTLNGNLFNKLDAQLIKDGQLNADRWALPDNVKYRTIVKSSNNVPVFQIKTVKSKTLTTYMFTDKGKLINDCEPLKTGTSVELILELDSIWIKNNIYGPYLKLHQVNVVSEATSNFEIETDSDIVFDDYDGIDEYESYGYSDVDQSPVFEDSGSSELIKMDEFMDYVNKNNNQ